MFNIIFWLWTKMKRVWSFYFIEKSVIFLAKEYAIKND